MAKFQNMENMTDSSCVARWQCSATLYVTMVGMGVCLPFKCTELKNFYWTMDYVADTVFVFSMFLIFIVTSTTLPVWYCTLRQWEWCHCLLWMVAVRINFGSRKMKWRILMRSQSHRPNEFDVTPLEQDRPMFQVFEKLRLERSFWKLWHPNTLNKH